MAQSALLLMSNQEVRDHFFANRNNTILMA